MKYFFVVLLGLLFLTGFVFSTQHVFGQAEEAYFYSDSKVYLAEIDGEIKAGTLQYVKRIIRGAEENKAEYLVIKLDTPGGLLTSTRGIVELLLGAKVKTAVFVHKEGGWAYSAGTFILLAADFAFVHPSASIGACQPQEMFGQETAGDKMIEGTVSWIKGVANAKERSPEIAEKFVRENLTLTGIEAEKIAIIDKSVRNLDELFLWLKILNPEIIKAQPTFIEKFFDFLSHPYLVSLFLTLGGLGLVFAFRTGEFELSGILGLILLFIGLWGIGVINFNILGIVFLALGILLLFLEILQPGLGIFGFLGIISLIFGIFTLEGEPFLSPQIFEAVTMIVLGAIIAIGILFVIIGRETVRALKKKPQTGSEALIGLEVEVIKDLDPVGQAILRGEIWQAESEKPQIIKKGEKVKILKVKGNTLFVGHSVDS